jgi:hypothetical protein
MGFPLLALLIVGMTITLLMDIKEKPVSAAPGSFPAA